MSAEIISPVSFSYTAISEIKRLMEAEQLLGSNKKLRVGVKGGGCSGMTYILEFSEKQPEDEEYQVGGVEFIMNPSHGLYLFGMQIDWQDGLNSRGFSFINPNASKTCGCGTSFSI